MTNQLLKGTPQASMVPRKPMSGLEFETRRCLGVLLLLGAVLVLINGKWITTGSLLVIGALLQPELVEASRTGARRLQRIGATVAMIPVALVMYIFPPPESAPEVKAAREPSSAIYIATAQQMIRDKLRDPGSAKFRNVRVGPYLNTKIVCGYVNSRNGFGGMTGYQRFAVSGMAVLEEEAAPGEMDLIWSNCPLS